jgi:hypothetical protein
LGGLIEWIDGVLCGKIKPGVSKEKTISANEEMK